MLVSYRYHNNAFNEMNIRPPDWAAWSYGLGEFILCYTFSWFSLSAKILSFYAHSI